ncbi:MAG TPA: lantibiotic dehydratase, partial [Thermoanaerobaculia bacterium]
MADAAATAALRDLAAAASGLAAARSRLAPAWEIAGARTSAEIERTAGWDSFREAVAWQSPGAADRALDGLLRRSGTPRNAALRRDEDLVASYLQRYCVKNDTIGFFGPVGWAEIRDDGGPVAVHPGPGLLEQRQVFFESWPIDALAARLAAEPGIRPCLAPRLRLGCHLRGQVLHLPGGREVPLPAAQAALLAECDGRRPARTIAAALAGRSPLPALATSGGVYALLAQLAGMGLVTWTLEAPLELRPEETLRQALLRVEPAALREQVLAPLLELDGARQDLARAAGDARQVQAAMRRLEDTFTRLTGEPARRQHGKFYAARGLVYEECRRGAEVAFGPELVRRLAPLGWLLAGARWLAGELARGVERRLRALHDELRQGSGGGAVDSFALVSRALPSLFYKQQRDATFVELESELQRRWAGVLALPATPAVAPAGSGARVQRTMREIADRFAAAFGEAAPAFGLVRWFSPDLMIAARGEAAFRAGEFQLVLGEIHAGNTLSWSSFVSQHPQPEQLLRNVERDLDGGQVVMPQLLKAYFTQRNNSCLVLPSFLRYELSEEAPGRPPCASLPAAEVV